MKRSFLFPVCLVCLAVLAAGCGLPPKTAGDNGARRGEKFTPLFNGKDLRGWVNVNGAPSTWTVRDGMIVCSGTPSGVLRTERMYENFVLELEWRHKEVGGNAGVFVWSDALPAPGVPFPRSIEVQVLDHGYARDYEKQTGKKPDWFTTHGDVFPIHGAVMKPFPPSHGMRSFPTEERSKGSPEWNHYRIECRDGVIKLAVNGKFVSGGEHCRPRKGYLCLESEGSETHFRNLRIRELPSSHPPPEEVAAAEEGFLPLYNGVDFAGWIWDEGHAGHWQARDWILDYDGQSRAKDPNLWTEKEYGDFELICDWRWTRKPVKRQNPILLPNGDYATHPDGSRKTAEVDDAGDSGIYLRGNSKSQINIWCWPTGSGEVYGYREDRSLPQKIRAGVTPKIAADNPIGQWNRFHITLNGDRLTVLLNGKTVLENAQLPGIPLRGRIGLQHHGDPIQFANLYVKERK